MLSFKSFFNRRRAGVCKHPGAYTPRLASRRKYVPDFEMLEDRLAPANTWTVTDNSDSNIDTHCLRYIINNNAASGDTIQFQSGGLTGGNIINLSTAGSGVGSALTISKNLTI